jgi:choline dehydrogenase-like flavoprotein
VLHADVCIVGGGPAGISIAMAFVGTPYQVCLIESGGLDSERDSQALNQGQSVGPQALNPAMSRLRTFGGSTRLWGGGLIPLSAHDMLARSWIPDSGWPIDRAALDPYYQRAHGICRVAADDGIDDGSFALPPSLQVPPPHATHVDNRTGRLSPIDFGSTYLPSLQRAHNIQVLLHANLMVLDTTANAAAVRQASIGSLDGRRGSVHARYYVLASGGIENARLLLLSNRTATQGLGNDHDVVGRYFMDHPRSRLGEVRGGGFDRFAHRYSTPRDQAPSPAYVHLGLTDQAQQALGLLNARARPFAVEQPTPPGLQSLRDLRASFRGETAPPSPGDEVEHEVLDALAQGLPNQTPRTRGHRPSRARIALRLGRHFGDVVAAGRRKLAHAPAVATDRVDVVGYFEQSPNRDSRIALGDSIDALGQRQVSIDWRLTDFDIDSYRKAAEVIGQDITAGYDCQFQPERWIHDAAAPTEFHGTAHHMGTTRMSDNPQTGVVDADCKVHGVDNLYIAGSSVFPTGSWAFPTFTIVALGLRVADTLRARLGDLSIFMV